LYASEDEAMKFYWIHASINGDDTRWMLACHREGYFGDEVCFLELDFTEEMTIDEYRWAYPDNEILPGPLPPDAPVAIDWIDDYDNDTTVPKGTPKGEEFNIWWDDIRRRDVRALVKRASSPGGRENEQAEATNVHRANDPAFAAACQAGMYLRPGRGRRCRCAKPRRAHDIRCYR